jgi:hypothetical protein
MELNIDKRKWNLFFSEVVKLAITVNRSSLVFGFDLDLQFFLKILGTKQSCNPTYKSQAA